MVWVLVGVKGCVLRPTGHSSATLFPHLCQLRTGRCIWLQASHRLIIPSTYLCMGAGKTCCSLVVDLALSEMTDQKQGGGGPCTALSLGLRSGGLESKFGRGPRHPGQESDGLVLFVPRVQVGRVFLGHLAGHVDSRITGKSGTACLRFSTVVRTES